MYQAETFGIPFALMENGVPPSPLIEDLHSYTTLALRNLPTAWDRDAARAWMDEIGNRGLYDFFVFFRSAKKASRIKSYAFVNYKFATDAFGFQQQWDGHVLQSSGIALTTQKLSVVRAVVQGLAENYKLWSKRGADAFFENEAVERLLQQQPQLRTNIAEYEGRALFHSLQIRNLPLSVTTHSKARAIFDNMGYRGKYDFFFYVPPRQKKSGNGLECHPYVVVNFRDAMAAKDCIARLDGMAVAKQDLSLSVVPSKVQGFAQLCQRYKNLLEQIDFAPDISGHRF